MNKEQASHNTPPAEEDRGEREAREIAAFNPLNDGDFDDEWVEKSIRVARALLSSPRVEGELDDVPTKDLERVIEQVLMDVCELPDRSSPDDQPEMMLVTGEELDMILKHRLGLEDRSLSPQGE